MPTTENGNHVTRAELSAHLGPINKKLDNLDGKVDLLLTRSAGDVAVKKYKTWVVGVAIALIGIGASVATTLVALAIG